MQKTAGVVILYNPDKGLHRRINSYLNQLDKLYIIDNTENGPPVSFSDQKILYMRDGVNKGIAKSLNLAVDRCREENFEWLLTMDQDSWFEEGVLENYFRCAESFPGLASVAMFGVQFEFPDKSSSVCSSKETIQLITSGSLLNLKLCASIGKFNEDLFIDQVDFDYSYRSILRGFKVVQFTNIFLQHNLGEQSEHRSLKSLKKTNRSLHSTERIYYMFRNYFYMRDKYSGQFPEEVRATRKDLQYRIKNSFLYGKRVETIKAVLSGYLDYRNKKMGKRTK